MRRAPRRPARRAIRWLVLMGLVGAAAVCWQRRRHRTETPAAATAPPEWPPFPPVATAAATPAEAPDAEPGAPTAAVTWREPVEGECPPGYPVKANDGSGIYHVPGGRFYDRTRPSRCYAEAADAEADGYRRAKA